MNERIRELARRVVGKHRNDVSSISLCDEQIEEFAELIVLRCAELSDLAEDHDLHGSTIIKRHFEVE